ISKIPERETGLPNTYGSFWRFSLTTGSLPSDSLATILPPLATRHSPLATRHYLLRPSPAGDCMTPTADCQRPNGARSRRAGPLSHYAPNQAIPAPKIQVGDRRRGATQPPDPHARREV